MIRKILRISPINATGMDAMIEDIVTVFAVLRLFTPKSETFDIA